MSSDKEREDFPKFCLREDGGSLRTGSPATSPRAAAPLTASCGPVSDLTTMSDPRQRAVMIEGVPHKYIHSVLDRLENRSKGGGRVQDWINRPEDMKLVVVFGHSKVAEDMLQQREFTIVDQTFKISRLPVDCPLPSYLNQSIRRQNTSIVRHQMPLESLSEHSMVSHVSMGESGSIDAKSIIIKDVPDSHEDCLKYFLENKNKGGGRLLSYERDSSNPKNVIAVFAHAKGVYYL